MNSFTPAIFDDHAQAIAKRQYMQPTDKDLFGMFRRVATWGAITEKSDQGREFWGGKFYQLMASQRLFPGGGVVGGVSTQDGNVFKCFF